MKTWTKSDAWDVMLQIMRIVGAFEFLMSFLYLHYIGFPEKHQAGLRVGVMQYAPRRRVLVSRRPGTHQRQEQGGGAQEPRHSGRVPRYQRRGHAQRAQAAEEEEGVNRRIVVKISVWLIAPRSSTRI